MAHKTAATTTATTARTTASTRAVTEAAIGARAMRGTQITVNAHLVTGEDIKSASITSDPIAPGGDLDGQFQGDDPRDQRATVTTDVDGVLAWSLFLDTAFPHASWRLTLTKAGDAEGGPDAEGVTDAQGHARPMPSASKTF